MKTMSDQILIPASMGQALMCWVWVYRCGSHCICMRLGDIMRCDRVLRKLDSIRGVCQPVSFSEDDFMRCACLSHECCVMHDDSLDSAVSALPKGNPKLQWLAPSLQLYHRDLLDRAVGLAASTALTGTLSWMSDTSWISDRPDHDSR